jgi:hypothetical protein
MSCSCIPLPADSPWQELCRTYGVDNRGSPQDDPQWQRNALALGAVQFACGRLACAGGAGAHDHAPGDAEACAALADAAAAALAGTRVGRGDEGDHEWRRFVAPALEAGPPPAAGTVTEAELRAALGGALCPAPALRMVLQPLAATLDAWERDFADGDEGADANTLADAVAPLRAARDVFLAGDGRASAAYARPAEGGRTCGAVVPHFLVARTAAGGLAGVCGFTVYT